MTKYPDMKPEQLVNLLMCRGDLSRADARQVPDNGGGNKYPTRMGEGGRGAVPMYPTEGGGASTMNGEERYLPKMKEGGRYSTNNGER